LLAKQVSAIVKGTSSIGKSYLVLQVLKFFPANAYYTLSAMSEHALAYSEEPLSHRILVIIEAVGMKSEFASYLIRSLLSEGIIRYETVEKTKDGLQAKLIEREGPIVTTTDARLHPENETRLFSIPTTDTRAQTEDIFLALAEESDRQELDMHEWQAFQIWLEHGSNQVDIPYAKTIAKLVQGVSVRLRRGFAAILNLIRSHALLHQATRDCDSQGRIVADIENDYAVVRDLVGDLVAEGVGATVSATVCETVQAVIDVISEHSDGGTMEATTAQVSTQLKLDKSAGYRRVQVAIERGYIKNLEDKKGRPARLIIGDPLLNDIEILPSVETLTEHSCMVAGETVGLDAPHSLRWTQWLGQK
jgi:hypothetical protein